MRCSCDGFTRYLICAYAPILKNVKWNLFEFKNFLKEDDRSFFDDQV
jgi:hypothetical protein